MTKQSYMSFVAVEIHSGNHLLTFTRNDPLALSLPPPYQPSVWYADFHLNNLKKQKTSIVSLDVNDFNELNS